MDVERTSERRVFCSRADQRAMLLDARSIDREYEPARARLDGEGDSDGLTAVRMDPDASWSPIAYRRSEAGVAVVTVCGPLEHHGGWWFDSYDSIRERVHCALGDESVRAIVLRIDSPGGVANGMVETSREIRSRAAVRGIPVYAYADEQMTSAAYGLACAADELWCPETGEIGSIGVILPVLDWTRAHEKQGIRTALITTGKRKGDGHPDKPLTDDVKSALQARVNAIGSAFFGLVAEARKVKPERIEALEAAVFIGDAAQKAGLVDGIAGWSNFLDIVESSIGGKKRAVSETLDKGSKKSPTTAQNGTGVAQARRKGTRMSGKLLDLVKAKDAAEAALNKAQAVEDPKRRAKAVEAATKLLTSAISDLSAVATYDAKSKMWKKTTKIEEQDDDDSSEDSSEDSASESEEDESEDDDAKSEDEEDEEDESEDDESGKATTRATARSSYAGTPRGYLADGLHTPRNLLRHVRQITGERDLPTAMDALSEMAAKASAYPELTKRIEKIETKGRSAKIKALVDRAIGDGRAFKGQRESLVAMGMRDKASLKNFLAKSPKRINTQESDLAVGGESGEAPSTATSGLPRAAAKAAEDAARTIAKMTGRDFSEVLKEVVAENRKIAASPRN